MPAAQSVQRLAPLLGHRSRLSGCSSGFLASWQTAFPRRRYHRTSRQSPFFELQVHRLERAVEAVVGRAAPPVAVLTCVVTVA